MNYWLTYIGYYLGQWWFNFKYAMWGNPGFIFLLWQNAMLTIIAVYVYKIWKGKKL